MNRLLITGKNGQLGQSFQSIADSYPEYEMIFTDRSSLDLNDSSSIQAYFDNHDVDVIINCAAYTAVDKAEGETELAHQVNCSAIAQLSIIANERKIKLIHVSTDYVFNGENFKPYIESDKVEPKNAYGSTKLAGEQALLTKLPENGLIIRTSWVYSEFGNNFVKTMKRLGQERDLLSIVADQVGTPTYSTDLASAIMAIVGHEKFTTTDFNSDVYHYSNEGICGWYDFAKSIFDLSDIECQVLPIETKDYPTPAKRPHYSVLNKAKIKSEFDIQIPHWQDSLKICLDKL